MCADVAGEVSAELCVEGVLTLKQKGQRALWSLGAQPALQEGSAVIADGLRGAEYALGRRLADAMSRVQHAIDGGYADPSGAGKIRKGRATQAKASTS
jgi:hypothetical protein